jgi:uncharacterized cupin superfamily protein
MSRSKTDVRVGDLRRSVLAGLLAGAAALLAPGAASASPLEPGTMVVYKAGQPVPQSELSDLGAPASLGGTVLEGNPRISARVDHARDGVLAGVFQATRGKVLIDFPFTEHATILEGEVRLTDQWGNRRRLRPGDSYLIRQGSEILWEVRGPRVQKSFFNRTEPFDSPAPMIVYDAHKKVAQSELADLGAPEGLGGTVVSGDPAISARIDYAHGPATAGVFQATRGDARIMFPFTEHATVLSGAVTLTDQTGARQRLDVGDSYLIRQGSSIFWHVGRSRVQKSFLNLVED